MAAPAVTFFLRKSETPFNHLPFGMIHGSVSITSYDTAHPAVAAITGKFKGTGLLAVICSPVSSLGFPVMWDVATSSFKAYTSNGAAPAALLEAPNTTNIGTIQFIAFGQMG